MLSSAVFLATVIGPQGKQKQYPVISSPYIDVYRNNVIQPPVGGSVQTMANDLLINNNSGNQTAPSFMIYDGHKITMQPNTIIKVLGSSYVEDIELQQGKINLFKNTKKSAKKPLEYKRRVKTRTRSIGTSGTNVDIEVVYSGGNIKSIFTLYDRIIAKVYRVADYSESPVIMPQPTSRPTTYSVDEPY